MSPLPPYIKRESTEKDKETYQTVYASERGSVAAPTAGLHLTEIRKKRNQIGICNSSYRIGDFSSNYG